MHSLNVCTKILGENGISYSIYNLDSDSFNIIDSKVKKRIEQVKQIAEDLKYVVGIIGGFVRDLLLKRPSKDVDFVIIEGELEKLTEEISRRLNAKKTIIHNQTLTTQIRFSDGIIFEFNAPRVESYEPLSRIPKVRRGTIIDDLTRRDFTINSLILFEDKYIDIFDGKKDLLEGIIRTTREPPIVFAEDYLRIFRALRFACLLDFKIEEKTKKGIIENAHQLSFVAKERIIEEIRLTAKKNVVCCFKLMTELAIIHPLFPELKNEKISDEHIISLKYEKIEKELEIIKQQKEIEYFLCFFALIMREQFIEKENYLSRIKYELKKFKFSKKEIEKILMIVKYSNILVHHTFYPASKKELRLLLREIFEIRKEVIAINIAENKILKKKNIHLEKIIEELRELSKDEELIFIKPAVRGDELMELGIKRMEINQCKEFLIHALMDEQLENTKEECIKYIKRYYLKNQ
ncbi:MAG: hypothetical protein ACTSVB_03120 [Candidatus Heimdallarchaeaceae archaeon]